MTSQIFPTFSSWDNDTQIHDSNGVVDSTIPQSSPFTEYQAYHLHQKSLNRDSVMNLFFYFTSNNESEPLKEKMTATPTTAAATTIEPTSTISISNPPQKSPYHQQMAAQRHILQCLEEYYRAQEYHIKLNSEDPESKSSLKRSYYDAFGESGSMLPRPEREWKRLCLTKRAAQKRDKKMQLIEKQMRIASTKSHSKSPLGRRSLFEIMNAGGKHDESDEMDLLDDFFAPKPHSNNNNPSPVRRICNASSDSADIPLKEKYPDLRDFSEPDFTQEAYANQYSILEYMTRKKRLDSFWDNFSETESTNSRMQRHITKELEEDKKINQEFMQSSLAKYYGVSEDEMRNFTGHTSYLGEDRPYCPHHILTDVKKLEELRESMAPEGGVFHIPFSTQEYHLVLHKPVDMTVEDLSTFLPGRTPRDIELFMQDISKYDHDELLQCTFQCKAPEKSPYGNIHQILRERNLYENSFGGASADISHRLLSYHWNNMEFRSANQLLQNNADEFSDQHGVHSSLYAPFAGPIVELCEVKPGILTAVSTNIAGGETALTCLLFDLETGASLPVDYGNTVFDVKPVGPNLDHFVLACNDGSLRVYESSMDSNGKNKTKGDTERHSSRRISTSTTVTSPSASNPSGTVFVPSPDSSSQNQPQQGYMHRKESSLISAPHKDLACFVDWSPKLNMIASCSTGESGCFLWNFSEEMITQLEDNEQWSHSIHCDIPKHMKKRNRSYAIEEVIFGADASERCVFGIKEGIELCFSKWNLNPNGSTTYDYFEDTLLTSTACLSPNGELAFTGDTKGRLSMFDIQTRGRVRMISDVFNSNIVHMACKDNYLAVGCQDFSVCVFDLRFMTHPLHHYQHVPHLGEDVQGVNRVSWNHTSGSSLLCTVADDQCTRVWDVSRDMTQPIRILRDDWRVNVSKFMSDDCSVVAGNDGNRITMYSINQKNRLETLL